MRYLAFVLALASTPAISEAPEMAWRYGCIGDKLVIQIVVSTTKNAGFQIVLPANVCGPSV